MDRIDFQKNLSRGSLFWEGDLVIFQLINTVLVIRKSVFDPSTVNFHIIYEFVSNSNTLGRVIFSIIFVSVLISLG
jgi:hypothetical protein